MASTHYFYNTLKSGDYGDDGDNNFHFDCKTHTFNTLLLFIFNQYASSAPFP